MDAFFTDTVNIPPVHERSMLPFAAGKNNARYSMGRDNAAKIYSLLRKTYPMWLRSSAVSHEAQKAVAHMNLLPRLSSEQEGHLSVREGLSQLDLSQDANIPFDKMTWDAYQDCIADFLGTFGADFMATDASVPFTTWGSSMTDPLFASMAEFDGWIAVITFSIRTMQSDIDENCLA